MRIPTACLLLLTAVAAARAEAPFPATGSANLAAYAVCRSLAKVDMGTAGSNSSADCTGVVKTRDGAKTLDNLAIHCLEEAKARPEGYLFTGTCVETDGDGDKLYLTYEGPESGDVALLGGTGKYSGVSGKGAWSVVDAPGNTADLFVFTLSYDVSWTTKGK